MKYVIIGNIFPCFTYNISSNTANASIFQKLHKESISKYYLSFWPVSLNIMNVSRLFFDWFIMATFNFFIPHLKTTSLLSVKATFCLQPQHSERYYLAENPHKQPGHCSARSSWSPSVMLGPGTVAHAVACNSGTAAVAGRHDSPDGTQQSRAGLTNGSKGPVITESHGRGNLGTGWVVSCVGSR